MRIACLTTSLSLDNGWGRYSYEIIRRLPDYGIEPVVFLDISAPKANQDGFKSYSVLRSFSNGIRKPINLQWDWLKIRSKISNCHIVHCFAEPFMPLAYLAASRNPKKLLVNAVGTYAFSSLNQKNSNLYYQAYKLAESIPTISHYVARLINERLPEFADKLQVIPLGVNTEHIQLFPNHQQFPKRENAFLAVGQVKARKGTLQAVEALAKVVEKFPEAKLYIAGSIAQTNYVQQVKNKINENNLENHVYFLGTVSTEELNYYYSRVRGLVMPSMNVGNSFEGFGLVHLEANSFGVPSIGSLDCGNEDAIKDGYSGFLVEQGNTDAIAQSMMKLLDPSFDWSSMSRNAINFAQSMSWNKVVESYVNLYQSIA
ncbi:glycosyltransferase family 4 protein [Phormidium sp. CCY1219]|uniref:glycosyltransferase family 4 protein n=1 Tax=Phormidium sp. CCY1219 TaxID=2886104 RepID=UPI002D1E8221|nr:glycosyltransferase family 4 protein [Phormidium sp. CCY1219]MEB3830089.1 glycosyltransferase family 4 protein [Phormidium sp. CCY1219]